MPTKSSTAMYTPLATRSVSSGTGSLEEIKKGIAHVESGGKYDAVGKPNSKGQKAYGKYQVFETNIPSWTKEAYGKSLTPDQFLKNHSAQERVADFYMGKSLQQYGNPDDVASTWFTGRPVAKAGLAVKDYTGTSNEGYLKKFHEGMGQVKKYVSLAERGIQQGAKALGFGEEWKMPKLYTDEMGKSRFDPGYLDKIDGGIGSTKSVARLGQKLRVMPMTELQKARNLLTPETEKPGSVTHHMNEMANGNYTPIKVRNAPEGLVIEDGRHRLAAAGQLGEPEMLVEDVTDLYKPQGRTKAGQFDFK